MNVTSQRSSGTQRLLPPYSQITYLSANHQPMTYRKCQFEGYLNGSPCLTLTYLIPEDVASAESSEAAYSRPCLHYTTDVVLGREANSGPSASRHDSSQFLSLSPTNDVHFPQHELVYLPHVRPSSFWVWMSSIPSECRKPMANAFDRKMGDIPNMPHHGVASTCSFCKFAIDISDRISGMRFLVGSERFRTDKRLLK